MSPVTSFSHSPKRNGVCNGLRVLVVTGSSGGHIFPALGLLKALKLNKKAHNLQLLLVLPETSKVEVKDCPVRYIATSNIPLGLSIRTVKALFNFIKGTLQSLQILLQYRPDIVVGFGSIDSLALVFFAWLFRIRTIIHEQNVMPGRANRLLAVFADRIAISFEGSRQYFGNFIDKVSLTGNPLRQDLTLIDKLAALDYFGFSKDKLTLLVMGGSQGSLHINRAILRTLPQLSDKARIQVIHITGQKENGSVEMEYKKLGIAAAVYGFFTSMQYAYSASDIAICRSGATTITELIFFKLPAILIPYPYAYKHQFLNAYVLESKGCAVIINDRDLEGGSLLKSLESLIYHPGRILEMNSAFKALLFPDNAAGILAQEALSLD